VNHELLLNWLSEVGSGDWDEFREAQQWVASLDASLNHPPGPSYTAHNLSILGHVEFDWIGRRWSCSPPVLTVLPNAGAHALLVGSRTRVLIDRFLEEADSDPRVYLPIVHVQRGGPNVVYLAAASEAAVRSFANRLGVAYEECVSERLASLLPNVRKHVEGRESALPPRGYGFERFEPSSLTFEETDSDCDPGLYKYTAWGGARYMVRGEDGRVHETDKSEGIYAELSRVETNVLHFEPDTVNGSLIVPYRAPLPVLQARTALLCTGLLPGSSHKGCLAYPNVPEATARAIADSLGQDLPFVSRQ
jgi:hypothetical protein